MLERKHRHPHKPICSVWRMSSWSYWSRVKWKRKHFFTDLFGLKNTNTHAVFILISKAEEAASIFISCRSLSRREGERWDLCVCVCLLACTSVYCCLQSSHLSVVICISFLQNPLRGFHANHSLSVSASVCQSLLSGKRKAAGRGTFLSVREIQT